MADTIVKLRLLIINPGEKTVNSYMRKFFERRHCQVKTVNSLKGFKMSNPLQFDAVIFDLGSFNEKDNCFLQFVKDFEAGSSFIFIGDPAQKEIIEKRLDCQIYDYLIRPISDFNLNRIIRNIINQRLLLDKNQALKERLKIFEKNTDQFFTKLENEVKRNTKNIAEKNEIWQRIFNGVRVGIIVVDENFTIIHANNFYSLTVKRPLEQILGEKYFKVIGLPDNSHDCPGYRVMKTGKAVSIEVAADDDNGQLIYVRQTAFPVFDSLNKICGFIEYNHDITEAKIERNRRSQSEKVEALYKFTTFFYSNLHAMESSIHDIITKSNKTRNDMAARKIVKEKDADFEVCLQALEQQIKNIKGQMADLLLITNLNRVQRN